MNNAEKKELYFFKVARKNCIDLTDMSLVDSDRFLTLLTDSDVVYAFNSKGQRKLVKGEALVRRLTRSGRRSETKFGSVLVAHDFHAEPLAAAVNIITASKMTDTIWRNLTNLLLMAPSSMGDAEEHGNTIGTHLSRPYTLEEALMEGGPEESLASFFVPYQ